MFSRRYLKAQVLDEFSYCLFLLFFSLFIGICFWHLQARPFADASPNCTTCFLMFFSVSFYSRPRIFRISFRGVSFYPQKIARASKLSRHFFQLRFLLSSLFSALWRQSLVGIHRSELLNFSLLRASFFKSTVWLCFGKQKFSFLFQSIPFAYIPLFLKFNQLNWLIMINF